MADRFSRPAIFIEIAKRAPNGSTILIRVSFHITTKEGYTGLEK